MESAPARRPASAVTVSLVKQLPVAAALLSHDGAVLEFNADAAELFGWQENAAARFPTVGTLWLRVLRRDVMASGRARALLTRRSGGRRTAVEVRASAAGANALLAVFRDCTAQLDARRARAAGERRLRAFLNRLPEPVIIEQHGAVAYANPAAARLLGRAEAAAVVGEAIDTILAPAEYRRIMSALSPLDPEHARPVETTVRRTNGTATVQAAALTINYRRKPAVHLLLRDVTSQRHAEAGLRATHERLRVITDAVREYAIMTVDRDGAIVSWNAGAERLMGYTAEAAVRMPFAELHVDRSIGAQMLELSRLAGRHEAETTIRRADGAEFRAHVTTTVLQDPARGSFSFAVILRDLTERMRAEENLRRSEEQLRHAQKMDAVGRLAAGIAHDFNNVLTAIQGHVQFLLEDLPADLPSRDDAMEIRRAADRAKALTRQLLTFARRQPIQPTPLDMGQVVRGVEKLLRRLIRADIRLETVLQDVPPVFADPGQLEQVIVNLVVNARDAMPSGGTVTVAITPMRLDETFTARGIDLSAGDYVQLAVSDTGTGMNAEVQSQVFEPFYTTKAEGTGLGLSTVYGIVQQSGGHVAVYSEEGVGTTFKVFLPVHGAIDAPVEAGLPDVAEHTGTVLLVEDDAAVRALAERTLASAGYRVITAADGEEGQREADAAGHIDVVLTDLMMPEMRGDELTRRLRDQHAQLGVVLMSGFSQETLAREGRIARGGHFLEKPFTQAALLAIVREAMRR